MRHVLKGSNKPSKRAKTFEKLHFGHLVTTDDAIGEKTQTLDTRQDQTTGSSKCDHFFLSFHCLSLPFVFVLAKIIAGPQQKWIARGYPNQDKGGNVWIVGGKA